MTTPAKGTAIVAVGFDDQTEALLSTAVSLARRFHSELRLVHVVAPHEGLGAFDYTASLYVSPLTATWDDVEAKAEAGEKMQKLLASLPKDVSATGVVLSGPPTPCIAAEAITRRANLIVVACSPDGYSALTQGFSTSIGLMHEAQLPVLSVSKYAVLDFAKPGFRILIADDLQEASHEAARKGYELATRLGHAAKVRHVHVHGILRALMSESLTPLQTTGKPTLEDQFDRDYEQRMATLKAHGDAWRLQAEQSGTKVVYDIRTGNVQAEIAAAAADFKPDLYVFGRHRLLRARPFLIGRMPFRTMLAEKRAVLLVPPTNELYQRTAFPAN